MNRIISMISSRSKYKNGILIENNIDTEYRYQSIIKDLNEGRLNQNKIDEFFDLLKGSKANSYQALSIIEKCEEKSPLYSKILVNKFTKNILPCIDDYKNINKEVDTYNGLTPENKNSIKEAIMDLEVADRIYNNHNVLSKRFNINSISNSIRESNLNIDKLVDKVYGLIETYDIKEYQKLNLTLEELTYLLSRSGVNYNSRDLYKSIIEHCVYNSDESMDNIEKVFTESKLIDKEDIEYIVNFLKKNNSAKDLTKGWWLRYIDRGNNKLPESIKEAIDNTEDSRLDLGIKEFVDLTDRFISNNPEVKEQFIYYTNELSEDIINRDLPREELEEINNSLSENTNNDIFKNIIDTINEEIDLKYPKYNLSIMREINEDTSSVDMKEFGLRYDNLLKVVHKFNTYLKRKEKSVVYFSLKNKFNSFGNNRLTSMLFGEDTNIYEATGSDNMLDVSVARINFSDIPVSSVVEFADSCIYEFNTALSIESPNSTCKAYYTLIEGEINFRVKDKAILNEVMVGIENSPSNDTPDTITEFINKTEPYTNLNSVYEYLNMINECNEFNTDRFVLTVEALKFLGVSKEDIKEFGTVYSDYSFNHGYDNDRIVNQYVNEWESYENTDLDIALEAYSILAYLFEDTLDDRMKASGYYSDSDIEADKERNKKDDDELTGVNDDDNTPAFTPNMKLKHGTNMDFSAKPEKKKKKLTLTDVQLMITGLVAKLKDGNNKAKMAVNNLDHSFNHFVTSIRNAQQQDRREQIIKGQVIPSFSKCIRMGIILAGMGVLVSIGVIPIIIPIITAIGAFAIDKSLTKKERLLVLDEIDTELDVIDKEIEVAQSNNQLNKYRALLRYKKNLQRQYQRIKYNINVGQDIAPEVGMNANRTNNE